MRIVSGTLKGRRFQPPANLPVRPTTDLAKESLFNVLNNLICFEDIEVLDLFAGTGGISYEFISRGAAHVLAIDNNFKCIQYIKSAAAEFHIENIKAYKTDVFSFLKQNNAAFDIIFCDPPYDHKKTIEIPDLVFAKKMLKEDGFLIIEHPHQMDFSKHEYFSELRRYGKVHFSFFNNTNPI
jgi:16S rRNA (guanine(966)-N(2))-methyltransferase RsmD